MKIITTKNFLLRSTMALAVMGTIHTPTSSWSAEPPEGKEMKMQSKMMEKCEEMKKEKQQMQMEIKEQDAELIAAAAIMNSAAEDKKIDLVARLVTQLVEQRTAMHAKKAKMEEKMMKHMMQHMQMGKESMSKCPMMKEMAEKSDGGHSEHHDKSE